MYVHGDSSETAIGSLLLQPVKCESPDDWRKHGFHLVNADSHQLNPTQRRWPIIRKELYSLMAGLERNRSRIEHLLIHLLNDHKPIVWLSQSALSDGGPNWAVRMFLSLMSWRLRLTYLPGSDPLTNLVDLFSRFDFDNDSLYGTIVRFKAPNDMSIAALTMFADDIVETTDSTIALSDSLEESLQHDVFYNVAAKENGRDANLNDFTDLEVRNAFLQFEKYRNFVEKHPFFKEKDQRFPCRYIPSRLRRVYFDICHSGLHAGHLVYEETFRAISRFAWWSLGGQIWKLISPNGVSSVTDVKLARLEV